MRHSQRAIVGALGLVVAIMLSVAIWVRLTAEPLPELSGERATRSFDYSGFRGLDLSGQWQVVIERGDAWQVAVELPVELADDVTVELEGGGGVLALGLTRSWWFRDFADENGIKATITMPALESLDISGATALSFSGFDGNELLLDISGAAAITGTASRFDRLTLDMSGTGNTDFGDVTFTDADVDVSGAGNVKLRMAGGRLTGNLSGAGNLEYSGTVREERINRSGFVNVRRGD